MRASWQHATVGLLGLTGLATLAGNVVHLAFEATLAATLIGIVPLMFVSLGLVGAAWSLRRPGFDDTCFLRVFLWTVLGAGVLAVLGAGFMMYQAAHGVPIFDVPYVVLNWTATGALIGTLVGYYDADRVQTQTDLRRERDRLREREAQLKRENERLDRFASIVSHDIRNPLNVAAGHLELGRETGDDAHLESVAEAHDRIATIVDEILTLTRQGDAVPPDARTPLSLETVAESAWDSVQTDDATLVVEGSGSLLADERRLRRILENLFNNAVEHAGPDVTVRVGWLDGGDGFYVADDGPGVDEDVDIFETGVTTEPGGTGLGLAIVDDAATAHGWTVHETGSADGGARFEIRGVATDVGGTEPTFT